MCFFIPKQNTKTHERKTTIYSSGQDTSSHHTQRAQGSTRHTTPIVRTLPGRGQFSSHQGYIHVHRSRGWSETSVLKVEESTSGTTGCITDTYYHISYIRTHMLHSGLRVSVNQPHAKTKRAEKQNAQKNKTTQDTANIYSAPCTHLSLDLPHARK